MRREGLQRSDETSPAWYDAVVSVCLTEGRDEVEAGEEVQDDEDRGDDDVDEGGGVLGVLEWRNGHASAEEEDDENGR